MKEKSFPIGGTDQSKLHSGKMRQDVIWTLPNPFQLWDVAEARFSEVERAT